mgnify:CR=1 FL=1
MAENVVGRLALGFFKLLGWSYYLSPSPVRRLWVNSIAFFLSKIQFRRKIIDQNLAIAFPLQKNKLVFPAYQQMAHLVVEILMLFGPLSRFIRKESRISGVEHWKKAMDDGKAAIFLASHVGNWEVMAGTGALQAGIDVIIVTKLLKPAWLHQAIEKGRLKCGYRGTYEPRTMKDILSQLKRKQTVGFVLDQYAGPPVGIRVPFFGVPVGTHTVVAMMAKRSGAVVLPVVNYRDVDGNYHVEIQAPLEWIPDSDPEKEIALNTAHYTRIIENHVRQHPEQWLWTHRRYKGDLGPLRPDEWSEGRGR